MQNITDKCKPLTSSQRGTGDLVLLVNYKVKTVTNNGIVKGGLNVDLHVNNMTVNTINDRIDTSRHSDTGATHTPTIRQDTALQMF